jgi:hypothetical protein
VTDTPPSLATLFAEVVEEMTREGFSVAVPPDKEDDDVDSEFWARIDRRLADQSA